MKMEPRPFLFSVTRNGCFGSKATWLPIAWVSEYPASLPPNDSGIVALAGPVITSGSTNVSSTWLFLVPTRSNWPLLVGSVREMTRGTPGRTVPNVRSRTRETVSGRP